MASVGNGADAEEEEEALFNDSSLFADISGAGSRMLNVSALCCDEETSGFDKLSGRTWIYPTNYPVRDYQFNIIQATVLNNTLVSLPTGSGKTFIAAVIMYNYYRWYPLGKIIFTAPTRPLVAQQIDACYNIVGIPPSDTIQMTGHMQVATRKTHWKDKRVFFATPQVIYNDLRSGICPADRVRCLVFDEAHRARGNYAYCQIVAALAEMGHKTYRVLALSATPGSKVEDVVTVVKNLHIAHLELRTESCMDVARYSHAKKIHTVVIPLGAELTLLRQHYVEILDSYARRLKQLNILPTNLGNVSRGRVVMLYKEYQMKERGARHPQHNFIMKDFTLLISLCHGLELLVKHGARVFLNFFDEHPEKTWMHADDRLTALLERLRDDLGRDPLALDTSTMPDGTVPEMPPDISFGHPKFDHLRDIMMDHFSNAQKRGQDTKAIVFCEYRESVNLVHRLLLQCRPLIKPHMFVGQGASGKDGKTMVSQKQQLRVMRLFREAGGACNALVATCVAEEGLDVGSVDLIVCFDISTRSPVRLVQRCGRTGRERGGQVYILVTEGREHQTLVECMRQRDSLNKRVLQSREVASSLYPLNPRMLPRDLVPRCQKMYITVPKKSDPKEKIQKKKQDVRAMLAETHSCSSAKNDGLICSEEFTALYPNGLPMKDYFEEGSEYWNLSLDELTAKSKLPRTTNLNLVEWLEWQRTPQSTVKVGHSVDALVLSELLQYADTKRFDQHTSTQNPSHNTQIMNTQALQLAPETKKKTVPPKKTKRKILVEPIRKDGDIRALFSTTKKSTKEYTKLIGEMGIDKGLPTSFIDLMVDLSEDNNTKIKCWSCEIIDCNLLNRLTKKSIVDPPLSILTGFNLPDINLLDNIDVELIEKGGLKNIIDNQDSSEDMFMNECSITENLFPKETAIIEENPNCSSNFNLDFNFDASFDGSDLEESHVNKGVSKTIDCNFDVGNIEDIFNDSDSLVDTVEKEKDGDNSDPKDALQFFGLDSLDDIFADSNDEKVNEVGNSPVDTETNNSKQELDATDINKTKVNVDPIADTCLPKSPSLLLNSVVVDNTIICSPILCSQKLKLSLSRNNNSLKSSTPFGNGITQKALHMGPKSLFGINAMKSNELIDLADSIDWSNGQERFENNPSTSKAKETKNLMDNNQSKSMFSITQLINIINDTKDDSKAAQSQNYLLKNVQADVTLLENKSDVRHNKMKSSNEINLEELNNERSSSPILYIRKDKIRNFKQDGVDNGNIEICENPNTMSNLVNPTQEERSSSPILCSQLDKKKNNIYALNKLTTSVHNKIKTNDETCDNPNVSNMSGLVNSIPDERSSSPILCSQLDKQTDTNSNKLRKPNTFINKEINGSLVILDSDDSDDTVVYELTPERSDLYKLCCNVNRATSGKRKFNNSADDSMFSSPYFNKRPKLDNYTNKPSLSLKDKLNKMFNKSENKDLEKKHPDPTNINFMSTSPIIPATQFKENMKPKNDTFNEDDSDLDDWFTPQKCLPSSPIPSQKQSIQKLQIFRRDSKNYTEARNGSRTGLLSKFSLNGIHSSSQQPNGFSDSDDDFVSKCSKNQNNHNKKASPVVNYKVRKKKKHPASEFIELEAALSSDASVSGDELVSGDSDLEGSILDFICDEPDEVVANHTVDMQAHYLRSVKSPAHGMFKIPEPSARCGNVLSQVDPNNDDYEMDSFCVDSHIGLTQAQDVSELELAERKLKKRRRRLKAKQRPDTCASRTESTVDSPLAVNKRVKKVKRQISSESSDEGD